jgi:hypothetical protein
MAQRCGLWSRSSVEEHGSQRLLVSLSFVTLVSKLTQLTASSAGIDLSTISAAFQMNFAFCFLRRLEHMDQLG